MTDKKIGPWPRGMDMVSTDEEMPRDQNGGIVAARDCYNMDFTRDGWVDSRPGFQSTESEGSSFLHSLWTGLNGSFGGQLTSLQRVTLSENGMLIRAHIADLPTDAPMAFDNLNGETVVCTRDYLGVIGANDTLRDLSVPDGMLPMATAQATGGFPAARYGVALAMLNARGEEGGLSPLRIVEVPPSGGIRLTLPAAPAGVVAFRIYRTGPNGRALRRAVDAPIGMTSFLLGNARTGRTTETQFLRTMKPGDYVTAWRGHLLTAMGTLLTISEPFRYSLTSPRHGFVQFPRPITFLVGVEGGVYVGQPETVVFLPGDAPKDWRYKPTGGAAPFPGSAIRVSSNLFDPQLQIGGESALWLAENGYVIGRADGQLTEPQSQRIRLAVNGRTGRTAVLDRRVITHLQ